jgi:hypothetical protein
MVYDCVTNITNFAKLSGNPQQDLAGTLTNPENELQLLEQLLNMRDRWGWVKTYDTKF